MIRLIELTTGQLMIVLEDKDKLQMLNNELRLTDEDVLKGMMETCGYIGEDWYCNQTIGLTEAPNICKGARYYDNLPNDYFESYIHYIQQLVEENVAKTPNSYKLFVEQDCKTDTDLPIDFEHVWYYPHYMIKSFVEELLSNGFVIFEKA
jgi:hypothetical protein